ncbi:MAG: Fe-S cluster assembly protein SufD [Planctomycetes bacterium]|nr:Fe-S cluster assembly protein SufD [Planctomycetota bacterium]
MSTTAASDTFSFDQKAFDRLIEKRIDPTWLTAARKEAWEVFQSNPWPSPRQENWMRSDLRGFRIQKYVPNVEERTSLADGTPVRLLDGVDVAGTLRSVDGVVTHQQLHESYSSRGVIASSLSAAAREHSELVRKHLHSLVSPTVDRFAALEASMWSDGYFIYIPRNTVVDRPIHIHAAISEGGVDLSHTLIVLEEGAEATVLYESASPDTASAGFHCGAVELVQRGNSHLRYVNLQDWGQNVWHFAHQRASVGRDASIQWTVAAMGSRFAQVDQRVALVEAGARSQVNGVMFTRDKQHLVYNTLQHHIAPHCTSDFLYKAVLQDRSRTVWRGMIKVDSGAQKTDGYQRNDNLMLSDKARADSIPGLEIQADDVRCTHGSTSGRIDEELIFYAQSRGFTRGEAMRMIVTGFFQQIFDRVTIESVREALGASIARQVRQYE